MYKVLPMIEQDVNESINLWNTNHLKYCNVETFPRFLPEGKKEIEKYLKEQIDKGNAIVIKNKKNIVEGYFSWIYINFHEEKTALCQTIGHCGQETDKENIYIQLYNYASKKWIKNDTFNHLWMIHCNDTILRELSFSLGFGAYVGDACIKIDKWPEMDCFYKIMQAKENDCESLFTIIEQSRKYYLKPPIFLKRKIATKEEILKIIKNEKIFVAWNKSEIIGFIHLWKNSKYHIEHLSVPGSTFLGIYIKPKYRGKGLGKTLLNKAFQYCNENSIKYLHVSFETSNINANRFWTKNLNPNILSVRRTVNKDANI